MKMRDMIIFCIFFALMFFGILIMWSSLDSLYHHVDVDPPTIEVVPKEVTIVPLSTQPIFIQGLAEPDPEPPKVEKKVYYVQQDVHGVLTATKGVNIGPTNKETWYNLDMKYVVDRMRQMGFSEEEYPYYIREDGAKCLGNYVMVAADLNIHPRGIVVETSLGQGLVCDTGDFTKIGDWYDLATDWEVP